jgi:hypothetical protein
MDEGSSRKCVCMPVSCMSPSVCLSILERLSLGSVGPQVNIFVGLVYLRNLILKCIIEFIDPFE